MYDYERPLSSLTLRKPLSKRSYKKTTFPKSPKKKKKFRDRFANLSPVKTRTTPIAKRRLRDAIEAGRINRTGILLDLTKRTKSFIF